jgi:hypothetical protein
MLRRLIWNREKYIMKSLWNVVVVVVARIEILIAMTLEILFMGYNGM